MSKFYRFRQNNSGGSFVRNDNLDVVVYIEADSHEDCMEKADDIGIYLDGCEKGLDCSCCGDRWSEPDKENGPIMDLINFHYDKNLLTYHKRHIVKVHLKDGLMTVSYDNGIKIDAPDEIKMRLL